MFGSHNYSDCACKFDAEAFGYLPSLIIVQDNRRIRGFERQSNCACFASIYLPFQGLLSFAICDHIHNYPIVQNFPEFDSNIDCGFYLPIHLTKQFQLINLSQDNKTTRIGNDDLLRHF